MNVLEFVVDKTEEYFDDFAYNGRRGAAYVLGKAGIGGASQVAAASAPVSSVIGGLAGAGGHGAMILAAPLSALFSAALVQGDFLHSRKKLLNQYREQISSWLNNGKSPEHQTVDDLYKAAFGDKKRNIPGNPALAQALTQNAKERNWGIGISVASTGIGTIAAHQAEHSVSDFIRENITPDAAGVAVLTAVSLGALGYAIYQAIKTPLHYLAECCFGVEKDTASDKIAEIRRVREAGKQVSQERVFEVYLKAHPEVEDMIRKEYGKDYDKLRKSKRTEVVANVGPTLGLAEVARDINLGYLPPEELAFLAFGQSSGVARRLAPLHREARPDGSLTKLAGRAARFVGFGKKGQVQVEEAIEALPTAEDLPKYVAVLAESPDGNTQGAEQAYQDEQPGGSVSFQERVGRKRGADGSMSFVQQVESTRTDNTVNR